MFCENTIKAWQLGGYLMFILKILVPVLVIITGMVPFLDAVIKGDSKTVFGSFQSLFRKLFAALLVFFAPTIIASSIRLLINRDMVNDEVRACSICFEKPNEEKCHNFIDNFEKALLDEAERFKQEEISGKIEIDDLNELDEEEPEEIDGSIDNQGSTGDNSGNNNSNNPSPPANGSTTSNLKGTANIIIGDSRTVGMCATFTGNWNGCGSGSPIVNGSDVYISKGSMGYDWFASSAVNQANQIISSNPSTTYNIFSLMGVNYLLSDINSYIPKYNELASGNWAKHRIILVSVNPVNEAIEAQNSYSTKNVNIESFNAQLKSGTSGKSNMTYCDVYNKIKGNFQTGDGLHYEDNTYKEIYNLMMGCV